jgi:hypothetical protein
MCMPDWGQNLTPTENVCRGFILHSTLPAQCVVSQPDQLEVSAQGIMSCKMSGNHPGLYPINPLAPEFSFKY